MTDTPDDATTMSLAVTAARVGDEYVTVVTANEVTRTLGHHAAVAYAVHVTAAAARAEYDASVINQMSHDLGLDVHLAADVVRRLRAGRRPLNPVVTEPLVFTPGVAVTDLRPFVLFTFGDGRASQLTCSQAREHAMQVLDCVATAADDAVYLDILTTTVGLDTDTAVHTVAGLDLAQATGTTTEGD